MQSGSRLPFSPDHPEGGHASSRPTGHRWVAAAAAILLVCGVLLMLVRANRSTPSLPLRPVQVRRAHRSPSAEQLWRARWYRARAIDAANRERYKLLESPPQGGIRPADNENWRRRLMAEDRTGDLRRALIAAREAARLAHGPVEEYRAREWLALIACDAGRHGEELAQARRLVALQPRNVISWTTLRRAAVCNHQWALAREAGRQLVPLLRGANQARRSAPYGPPHGVDE